MCCNYLSFITWVAAPGRGPHDPGLSLRSIYIYIYIYIYVSISLSLSLSLSIYIYIDIYPGLSPSKNLAYGSFEKFGRHLEGFHQVPHSEMHGAPWFAEFENQRNLRQKNQRKQRARRQAPQGDEAKEKTPDETGASSSAAGSGGFKWMNLVVKCGMDGKPVSPMEYMEVPSSGDTSMGQGQPLAAGGMRDKLPVPVIKDMYLGLEARRRQRRSSRLYSSHSYCPRHGF